jgi:membrane protease YdiL (CAAX protease family)
MKLFIKTYWKTLLFFAIAGLIGGFFTGIYVLDSYSPEIQQQLLDELADSGLGDFPPDIILGMITAIQAMGYGIILGAVGIRLSKKLGLWRDEKKITIKPLIASLFASVVGGSALILSDLLFFGNYSQIIMDSYSVKPTVPYLIASVLYGGVIEEVMLRLFWMSLLAFILWRVFDRKNKCPSKSTLVAANIIAALLFAAAHLPATAAMLGLSPIIVFRCFLLNGGMGLLFGWLYRKYGLRYAMIAHGGCHIVSKLIWILFI